MGMIEWETAYFILVLTLNAQNLIEYSSMFCILIITIRRRKVTSYMLHCIMQYSILLSKSKKNVYAYNIQLNNIYQTMKEFGKYYRVTLERSAMFLAKYRQLFVRHTRGFPQSPVATLNSSTNMARDQSFSNVQLMNCVAYVRRLSICCCLNRSLMAAILWYIPK